jgi:RNA polymerase sigma-70 factor, ECF subfamily
LATITFRNGHTVDCEAIIRDILRGNERGEELLHLALVKGLRYFAVRQVGIDDADECVNDTFLALVRKIREGAVEKPEALLSYARTILHRIICARYTQRKKWQSDVDFDTLVATKEDSGMTPEQLVEANQRVEIMRQSLRRLRPREQEVLYRFYLDGQTPTVICREMKLNETQFRLLKSRSKQKLEDFTTKYLNNNRGKLRVQAFAAVC